MPSVEIREHRIETDAGKVYAKRWIPGNTNEPREAAPVVLFHDSLGSVELWRDFPEQLACALGRDVIAYDRLGFGQSSPRNDVLEKGFIFNEADGVFANVCEDLGIEGFIALGHSVGGAMAAVCAERYANRCQSLITIAAQAFVEDCTVKGILDAEAALVQGGQINRLEKYHGEKADWVLRAWVDTWVSDTFKNWSMNDTLAGVSCPVLAIHGEEDEYGSPAQPKRYTSLPSGPCVMKMLPGCGHVPHREQPETVINAVHAFLVQHLADQAAWARQ